MRFLGITRDRAAAIFAAGCDIVLHCNGRIEEMRAIAGAAPALAGEAGERAAARARGCRATPLPFDRAGRRARSWSRLLARAGWLVAA